MPGLPSHMRADVELRPHQEEAVRKVIRQNGNLLLSHPVGSGKSPTAIAAHDRLRQAGMANRALVVTPASLRTNFGDAVRKFTTARVATFGNVQEVQSGQGRHISNPDPKADYHIVSYDLFRTNPEAYIKAAGADTVIYDELHRIKNVGLTGLSLKEARQHHRNFIGLTGSIVSNTPADLVPLVDAMTNGNHHLGTKENFERRFVSEDGKLQNAPLVRMLLNPYVHHVDASNSGGHVPTKQVETVNVDMSPEQQELYQYVVGKMDPVTALKFRFGATKLKTNDVNNIFNKMTQARQVANAIHTVNQSVTLSESAERSPKIKKVLDDVQSHLEETPDGQVIVYSNMIKGGVDVLSQGMHDRGIDHGVFVGKGQPGSTEKSRQEAVQGYKEGKKRVILLSSAGGEGLDLGNTTFVANVDGHFNPEKIYQAEARGVRAGGQAHRPEEERRVLIRRYVTRVPLSKTQALRDAANLISPMMILNRAMDNAPILYNPLKRERSPDEWAYEVAHKKDVRNAQLRGVLDKHASLDDWSVEDIADLVEEGLEDRAEKIAAPGGRCLQFALADIEKHPERTLVMGPAGHSWDTAHFWTEHQGQVYDRAAHLVPSDYVYRGRIVDPESVRQELQEKIAKIPDKKKENRMAAMRLPMQPYKYVKSDRPIMDAYAREFAPHLESAVDLMATLPVAALPREQQYVDALHAFYREAAKAELKTKMLTDEARKREMLKQTLALAGVGAFVGGLNGLGATAGIVGKAPGAAAAITGGAALLGAGVIGGMAGYEMLTTPAFTTDKTRARRMSRLTDEQYRMLLRGMEVKQIEEKMHQLAIGSNARAKTTIKTGEHDEESFYQKHRTGILTGAALAGTAGLAGLGYLAHRRFKAPHFASPAQEAAASQVFRHPVPGLRVPSVGARPNIPAQSVPQITARPKGAAETAQRIKDLEERLERIRQAMKGASGPGPFEEIMKKLKDPNYVWEF